MNKRILLIWTFLLCFVMGMSADKVIVFNENSESKDLGTKLTKVSEIVKSGSEYLSGISDVSDVYLGRAGRGLKLGASSKVGKMTLNLADACKPTAIKFKAMWYKSGEQTLTVAGQQFANLTSAVAEYTVTLDGNTEVSSIAIATAGKRAYITEVTIVEGEAAKVATPTITGTTPFFGTTTVTLGCTTEGANVYYTLDGNEPTSESTKYTEPFTIDKTTTVKAIASDGENLSNVATKEFVLAPTVATIAELTNLSDKTEFLFSGEATVVALPTAKNLFLKDATGYTLAFDATGEKFKFEVGQHIAGGWKGTVSMYNSLFEVVPTTDLTAVTDVKDEITYDTKTAADVTVENANTVAYLKGVTYTAPASGKKNFDIKEGETTVAGYNQFGIDIAAPVEGRTYDILGVIGRYNDNAQFQPISITAVPLVVNIDIVAESGADLATLVENKVAEIAATGDKAGNVSITLAKDGAYTVSKTIGAGGNISVVGDAEGLATIDASALETPVFQLAAPVVEANENGFFPIGDVTFKNIKVTGVAAQLFYANKQKVLIDNLVFNNSIVQVAGGTKTVFDTNGGGVIGKLDIQNSTIYANPQNTGALYSSQSGTKATDAGLETQTISIQNSTLYNIAYNKNVNTHRSANQKWLTYVVKNNIVLDCGKEGQFVKGLNGGQNGANPVWDIDTNSFLRTVEGVIVDQSAMETTGDADEPVKNNVADYTSFADLANGVFTIEAGSLQAKMKVGDPRWLVEYDATQAHPIDIVLNPETETDLSLALNTAKENVDKIGSITINLAADAKYTVSAPLETVGEFSLTGVKENPATIDASANAGAFLQFSATPDETTLGTGEYYHVKGYVNISNVNIDNVKGQLVYDNNVKYCVENLTIDNCKVRLASDEATGVNSNAVVYFKGGFANTLSVSNSTFWNTGASDAKYFVQYNNSGRSTRAGYDNNFVIFQNNTFHNVAAKGQWANYTGFAGQNCSSFVVTDNIFSNSGSGQIARRILGGRGVSSYAEGMVTFNNNTYMTKAVSEDNVETTTFENDAQYDASGTVIEMDPLFKDAANADFTLGASTKQAKLKTGDPRWLVEFVAEDVTNAKAALLAEIQKATKLLGDADTETDEAAKALKDAIDKAQNTYDNSEFNSELEKALEELKAAEEAYNTTAISNVDSEKANDGAWYTLQGVKVEKAQKGIFIHNGKKVVLK